PLIDWSPDCGRLENLLQLLEREGGDHAIIGALSERDKSFAEVDEAYQKFHANPDLMYEYDGGHHRKGDGAKPEGDRRTLIFRRAFKHRLPCLGSHKSLLVLGHRVGSDSAPETGAFLAFACSL
ncbi:MAG: hypothetical protein ACOYM2_17320, partial [Rectinemataceae bacterium]